MIPIDHISQIAPADQNLIVNDLSQRCLAFPKYSGSDELQKLPKIRNVGLSSPKRDNSGDELTLVKEIT